MTKELPECLTKINTESTAFFEATISHHAVRMFMLVVTYTFLSRNSVTGEIEQLSDDSQVHICFEATAKKGALHIRPAQNNPSSWYKMFATADFFTHLIAAAKTAAPQAKYLIFESLNDDDYLVNIFDEAPQFEEVLEAQDVKEIPFSSSFKEDFFEALDEENDDNSEVPAAFSAFSATSMKMVALFPKKRLFTSPPVLGAFFIKI